MTTSLLRVAMKGYFALLPAVACFAAGCVDLNPPWQQGHPDAAGDSPQVISPEPDAPYAGGALGGTGGTLGSGGVGGSNVSGPTVDGAGLSTEVGSGGTSGIDAPPLPDTGDMAVGDGAQVGPDAPGSDLAATGDAPIADLSTTGSGGAGGGNGDAARDAAIGSGGATGRGGTTGGGGTTAKGGTTGSGGTAAKGGTAGSGGTTAKGGTTGTGGATAADASVSACLGYQAIDAGEGGSLSQGLVAYYPCEQEGSGATLADSSGNNNNATLAPTGTDASVGYSFATGRVNNALFLNKANKGYVALPAGILAGACEATIATWIYLNTNSTSASGSNTDDWQRVFDFGKDANVYMFLASTNNSSHLPRFGISITGNGSGEQHMDGQTALPAKTWTHVAVVLGTSGVFLYVNGTQLPPPSPPITLRPADMGSTTNNYIGRSEFSPDPYLDGAVDEFRVYNRALSSEEVQALATP